MGADKDCGVKWIATPSFRGLAMTNRSGPYRFESFRIATLSNRRILDRG